MSVNGIFDGVASDMTSSLPNDVAVLSKIFLMV